MTTLRSPAFAPFQVRSFRFQWPADLATSLAFEMEVLILGWYVLVETGSVQLLAVFGALQYVGALVSPLMGVAGDRIGQRNLLCITRALFAVLAASLLLMAIFGALTPLRVLAVAGMAGLIRPADTITRNTLVAHTMTPAQLMGALGMSRVTGDAARVAGALAGAGVVAVFGMVTAYAVVLGLYAISFALSLGVSPGRAGSAARSATAPGSPWGDLRHVFGYVWRSPALLGAMAVAFMINVLAFPFVLGLLPYVTREVYGAGQTALGTLTASFAAGGLTASIVLGLNRLPLRPARTMLLATGAWFVLTIAFGQARSVTAGAITLAFIGFVQNLCVIPLSAVMLRSAGDEIRGRVMGMRMLAVWGLQPGLLLSAPLIGTVGFAMTTWLFALAGLAFTALIAVRWRSNLWDIRAHVNARL